MSDHKQPCPICKLGAQHVERLVNGHRLTYTCERCGRYKMTDTAEAMAEKQEAVPKLSAWIRDINENGASISEIDSKSLKEITKGIPDYSPSEKQSRR